MDVQFIDATDWLEQKWLNTGGTRAKRVLQAPDGSEWYFKRSEKKPAKGNNPEKYYRYEFWSEIIAYQLGTMLGLNVLRYDVGINGGEIGCISPLMIDRDEEQLIEVGRYMTSLNPAFLPEDNSTRHEYTFQLLEKTIDEFSLSEYWVTFFETLLFDAIIGNTDRHQENWAFLGKSTFIHEVMDIVEKEIKLKGFKKLDWITRTAYRKYFNNESNEPTPVAKQMKLQLTNLVGMAPIYDNGSSLGRELTDERVEALLNDEAGLMKYIKNGKAEVHWDKKKVSHFELIGNLLHSSYLEQVLTASSFLGSWNDSKVRKLIINIDESVPEAWHSYCIPKLRKELLIKILPLRTQILRRVIHDRV